MYNFPLTPLLLLLSLSPSVCPYVPLPPSHTLPPPLPTHSLCIPSVCATCVFHIRYFDNCPGHFVLVQDKHIDHNLLHISLIQHLLPHHPDTYRSQTVTSNLQTVPDISPNQAQKLYYIHIMTEHHLSLCLS